MAVERKTTMISARVPQSLVDRVDFVHRNIDSEALKNRSLCVQHALEDWLPDQEKRLTELGVPPPKKAR